MAYLRVRDRTRPDDTSKDVDLGPFPEVRLRVFPRHADIDSALVWAAKSRRMAPRVRVYG